MLLSSAGGGHILCYLYLFWYLWIFARHWSTKPIHLCWKHKSFKTFGSHSCVENLLTFAFRNYPISLKMRRKKFTHLQLLILPIISLNCKKWNSFSFFKRIVTNFPKVGTWNRAPVFSRIPPKKFDMWFKTAVISLHESAKTQSSAKDLKPNVTIKVLNAKCWPLWFHIHRLPAYRMRELYF